MSDDVFSAFGRGFAGFAQSRAGDLVGDSFSDTGKLIESIFGDASFKEALDKLKADIKALSATIETVKKAIDAEVEKGKAAAIEMADEVGKPDFGVDELARFMTALVKLLVAYDAAITIIAAKLAEAEPAGPAREAKAADIKSRIGGMHGPIKKVFGDLGDGALSNFNKLCKVVLNVDDAAAKLEDDLKWDYANKRLTLNVGNAGPANLGPLAFDGGSLLAFFQYKEDIRAGLEIKTNLKAGLRSGALLEKIMPGQGATADASSVAFTLDTTNGLTFGSGPDKRIVVPARLSLPGVELRELAIVQPAADNPEGKNRVDVVFTIAGELGGVFACVVEGGGISIRWVDGGDPEVTPKIPSGAGMRIKTPLVTGGGYLRYEEATKEYGGVFQLEIAKVGVTAFGLIGTEPFSIVLVIGARFSPKIELGWGFTLNALGGIIAIERRLNSDALMAGMKDDVIGQLLFPADPVASAPSILNALAKVFPPEPGGFVIGPIAEIGWGSQAGFVKARLGLIFALPDPRIAIIGAVQIGVPSADVEPKARLVDINANVFSEITPDYFLLKVEILKSRLFTLELSGSIVIYVQWAGEGAFVLSVGGFFPDYQAPAKIGPMNRLAVKFAPPVDWISIAVQAYFAITSNSVQFGGRVDIKAKVGPASAEAWVQIDALFQWAPYFAFEVRLDVGIKVKAFGVTLAGVQFVGILKGDKPFYLEGNAKCEILFWDVEVPIGPLTWGEKPPVPMPILDVVQKTAEALTSKEAWTPVLPPGAMQIVRFAKDAGAKIDGGLYHPLGELEVRQNTIPLEYNIDRVGSAAPSTPRINIAAPTLGGHPAGAVWPAHDAFAPGHFLNLTDDQVMSRPEFEQLQSGVGISGSKGAAFGAPVHAVREWATCFPNRRVPVTIAPWIIGRGIQRILGANAVATARKLRDNPYVVQPRTGEGVLKDRGLVDVVSAETLGTVAAQLTPGQAGRIRGVATTVLEAGML